MSLAGEQASPEIGAMVSAAITGGDTFQQRLDSMTAIRDETRRAVAELNLDRKSVV